jgi:hypothetical protein
MGLDSPTPRRSPHLRQNQGTSGDLVCEREHRPFPLRGIWARLFSLFRHQEKKSDISKYSISAAHPDRTS